MRIHGLEAKRRGSATRLSATVEFEAVDRPAVEVHFEHHGPSGEPRVEPFVATAAIIADGIGERKLTIDAPIDPRVVANVRSANALLRAWFLQPHDRLEWSTTDRIPAPAGRGAAFCLTGGIDSTALLVVNHETYPPGHPLRVDTGLVVYGLDESTDGDIDEPDRFLRDLADRFGIAIRAVRTNIRALDPSTKAWTDRIQAAVLAGAGHAALADKADLLIAPSDPSEFLEPYATHHALDHRFSSTELRVHHEHIGDDRLDRVAIVAGRPELLPLVQVCNLPRSEWGEGTLNCGRCEKCVRTKVGLLVTGVREAPSFAVPTVTAADVDALPTPRAMPDPWIDYVPPLRAVGEEALADAVVRYVARIERMVRLRRAVGAARAAAGRLSRR